MTNEACEMYHINFNELYDELTGRVLRIDERRLDALVGMDGLYRTSDRRDVERIVGINGGRAPNLDEYESGAFEM